MLIILTNTKSLIWFSGVHQLFFWLFHQGDAYQKAVHLLRSKVGCAETLWAFWSFVGKEWVNWVSWGALGDLIMCLDCCLFVSDARPFTPDVALLMEHFQLAVKALELQLLGGEQEVKVTQWNFFRILDVALPCGKKSNRGTGEIPSPHSWLCLFRIRLYVPPKRGLEILIPRNLGSNRTRFAGPPWPDRSDVESRCRFGSSKGWPFGSRWQGGLEAQIFCEQK